MVDNYQPITACKQYCLAAGATQGNIAYTQNVKKIIKNNNNVASILFAIFDFVCCFLILCKEILVCRLWLLQSIVNVVQNMNTI